MYFMLHHCTNLCCFSDCLFSANFVALPNLKRQQPYDVLLFSFTILQVRMHSNRNSPTEESLESNLICNSYRMATLTQLLVLALLFQLHSTLASTVDEEESVDVQGGCTCDCSSPAGAITGTAPEGCQSQEWTFPSCTCHTGCGGSCSSGYTDQHDDSTCFPAVNKPDSSVKGAI
jgi:hypothetical protein